MQSFKFNLFDRNGPLGLFELSAPTAFIPVGFGVMLLACSGVKAQNKVVAHIAVLLTLLILVALCGMTLPKFLNQEVLAY